MQLWVMYSISQGIVQMGKDWIQTVRKERNYHAERYVETSFGRFHRKLYSVKWSNFNTMQDICSL